jgi:FPC/CPF motif-containing protein YcgG
MATTAAETEEERADGFRDFVRDPEFPCVGAKAALSRGGMRILTGRDITSGWDDLPIIQTLLQLADSYRADPVLFQTLVVIFGNRDLTEIDFEHHMWLRLQSLTDKDEWLGERPDPRVSTDPDNPHFSLSFGGEAFFAVGLHPQASRPARRFESAAIVFNLHDQFEQLRAAGKYEKLRETIIQRDIALAGDANPMLARHGTSSEARQYSGREVEKDWVCPFSGRGQSEN